MLPIALCSSECVLHCVHSCSQRHASFPIARLLSVEASTAEWERTQLSTQDHAGQGPRKQQNKQNSLSKQRKVRVMHPQHLMTYTKQKRLCASCPHGSLQLAFHQYEAQTFLCSHCKTQNGLVTLKMFALQRSQLCWLLQIPFPNLKQKQNKSCWLKYIFIHSFLYFLSILLVCVYVCGLSIRAWRIFYLEKWSGSRGYIRPWLTSVTSVRLSRSHDTLPLTLNPQVNKVLPYL